MINLKNNKGITLTTLIITVIVLVTIAGTAVYTGMDVYQDAKEESFVQELQMMQNVVNNEASKIESGQKKYGDYIIDADKIDGEAFIEYTPQEIENKFGVTNIKQNLKINLITKEVKSVNGIVIDGTRKYSLKELGVINQVIGVDDNVLIGRYVQEGLILHLDAINNTGQGHSQTQTAWTDLVTNTNTNVIGNTSGQSIWSDKAFIGHGTEYFDVNLPEFHKNGTGTMEVLVTRNNEYAGNTSNYTLIGKFVGGSPATSYIGVGGFLSFRENSEGEYTSGINVRYSYDGTPTNYEESNFQYSDYWTMGSGVNRAGISVTIDYKLNTTIIKFITNGVKNSEKTITDKKLSYRAEQRFNVGKSGYFIEDYIHNVRAYNRALTETEVLHNYYIDIYRFQ